MVTVALHVKCLYRIEEKISLMPQTVDRPNSLKAPVSLTKYFFCRAYQRTSRESGEGSFFLH
jgi:hypothetical protein